MTRSYVLAGTAVLTVVVVCTTVLVGLGDVDGDLFIGAVVGPIVGGVVGAVSAIKGVQSGSQASVDPPPDA